MKCYSRIDLNIQVRKSKIKIESRRDFETILLNIEHIFTAIHGLKVNRCMIRGGGGGGGLEFNTHRLQTSSGRSWCRCFGQRLV
jgi:hypothetical protein